MEILNQYKCKLCLYVFEKQTRLSKHYFQVHQKYICLIDQKGSKECEAVFDSKDLLKLHLVNEHRRVFCDKCDCSYSTQSSKKRHYRTAHLNLKATCSRCGKKFSDFSNMHRHEQTICNPDHPLFVSRNPIRFRKRSSQVLDSSSTEERPVVDIESSFKSVIQNVKLTSSDVDERSPAKKPSLEATQASPRAVSTPLTKDTNGDDTESDSEGCPGTNQNLFDITEVGNALEENEAQSMEIPVQEPQFEDQPCDDDSQDCGVASEAALVDGDHPGVNGLDSGPTLLEDPASPTLASCSVGLSTGTASPVKNENLNQQRHDEMITSPVLTFTAPEQRPDLLDIDIVAGSKMLFVFKQWFLIRDHEPHQKLLDCFKRQMCQSRTLRRFMDGSASDLYEIYVESDKKNVISLLKTIVKDTYIRCIHAFLLLEFAVLYFGMDIAKLITFERELIQEKIDSYYTRIVQSLIRIAILKCGSKQWSQDYLPFHSKFQAILPSLIYSTLNQQNGDPDLLRNYQLTVKNEMCTDILSVLFEKEFSHKHSILVTFFWDKILRNWLDLVVILDNNLSFFYCLLQNARLMGHGTIKVPSTLGKDSNLGRENIHEEIIKWKGWTVEKFENICKLFVSNSNLPAVKTLIEMMYCFPKPTKTIRITYEIATALEAADALEQLYFGSISSDDKTILWLFESDLDKAATLLKYGGEEQCSKYLKDFDYLPFINKVFRKVGEYAVVKKVFDSPDFQLSELDRFQVLVRFSAYKCNVRFKTSRQYEKDEMEKLKLEFAKVMDLLNPEKLRQNTSMIATLFPPTLPLLSMILENKI